MPVLPEPRYDHVSFAIEDVTVVTCGGRNRDNHLGDCLALNTTTKQWQRGLIGILDQARIYASALRLPGRQLVEG